MPPMVRTTDSLVTPCKLKYNKLKMCVSGMSALLLSLVVVVVAVAVAVVVVAAVVSVVLLVCLVSLVLLIVLVSLYY